MYLKSIHSDPSHQNPTAGNTECMQVILSQNFVYVFLYWVTFFSLFFWVYLTLKNCIINIFCLCHGRTPSALFAPSRDVGNLPSRSSAGNPMWGSAAIYDDATHVSYLFFWPDILDTVNTTYWPNSCIRTTITSPLSGCYMCSRPPTHHVCLPLIYCRYGLPPLLVTGVACALVP